jgi:hypothetical protein
VVGTRNGRAIEGGGGAWINFQLPRLEDGKEGEGRWVGAVGVPVGAASTEEKKGAREEEEGDADRWGRCVSDIEEKKEAGETGLLREGERWAGGPAGLKGVRSSFFFSFLFQTLLKFKPFQLKFHSKFLKLFQKNL